MLIFRVTAKISGNIACYIKYNCYICSVIHSEPHDILKFATMETKAFIKDYVRKNIVNHKVDFGNDAFKVKGFKVHQAKHTIRRDEFDDYGVDPDTQSFITIEFWDSANEIVITDASNRRIYARIIWCAENSVLVTPHTRYIVTSKNI